MKKNQAASQPQLSAVPAPNLISVEQAQSLLENLVLMVIMINTSGKIIFANQAALNKLCLSNKHLIGKDFFEICFTPDEKIIMAQALQQAINTQQTLPPFISTCISKASETNYIRWENSLLLGSDGAIQKIIFLGEDITAQKNAEKSRDGLFTTLEQHVADRTRELATLYNVATIANEDLDLSSMLEKMLSQALSAIAVPYGAIHLFSENNEELRLVVQIGIPSKTVKKIASITPGFGLTGWVAERKGPLTLTNVSDDPRILSIGRVSGFGLYLSAPLKSKNKIVGVISVFGDSPNRLNPEQIALLTTIADQIGNAVEHARLRQQAEKNAILEERQRLSRELHDSVTQSLYSLTLLAAAGQRSAQDGSLERTARNMDRIGAVAFQTLKEMRLLVYELQPSMLGPGGFIEAIQHRLDAVEEHAGIQTRLNINPGIELSQPVEIELYGITQEALNNSIKHGLASSVVVGLTTDNHFIKLEISDNGQGFEPETAKQKHGTGLSNMQKRVEKLGGNLKIISSPGKGTLIQVLIPVS